MIKFPAAAIDEDGADEGKAATGDGADMADVPEESADVAARWLGGLIRMYLPGEPCADGAMVMGIEMAVALLSPRLMVIRLDVVGF